MLLKKIHFLSHKRPYFTKSQLSAKAATKVQKRVKRTLCEKGKRYTAAAAKPCPTIEEEKKRRREEEKGETRWQQTKARFARYPAKRGEDVGGEVEDSPKDPHNGEEDIDYPRDLPGILAHLPNIRVKIVLLGRVRNIPHHPVVFVLLRLSLQHLQTRHKFWVLQVKRNDSGCL